MKSKINFLGINTSSGQPHLGTIYSSQYIRTQLHLLHDYLKVFDQGDIDELQSSQIKIFSQQDLPKLDWSFYAKAYIRISHLLATRIPLVNWGGDHSIGVSTVGAFTKCYPNGHVLWIDAHADLNHPDYSLSGNFHGMPMSILLNINSVKDRYFGWLKGSLTPDRLIYLGLRDLDPFEVEILKKYKIKYYTAKDVLKKGIHKVTEEISQLCSGSPLHISFDIDSVDPLLAPSTGIHVPEGLNAHDLLYLGSTLANSHSITSLDIVEINPLIGTPADIYKTNLIALNFIRSIFHKEHFIFQGGFNDELSRANKVFNSASLESSA